MATVWERSRRIQLTCPKGLTGILAKEVEDLGFEVVQQHVAAVELEGTLGDCLLLNLWLRTAHRVLFLLSSGNCRDGDELYRMAQNIAWEDLLPQDGYFTITSSVRNSTIHDTRFANLKLKDAIVDRMRDATGRRPDTGPERNKAVIFLYWKENEVSIYLDTSGEPLSHRGYRKVSAEAPMRETLAAACVLHTEWTGDGVFVNPMCGSGTLAIEAAWIAKNYPPAGLRCNFAFMHIEGFESTHWDKLKNQAKALERKSDVAPILASDHDTAAIKATSRNAAIAMVDDLIEVTQSDFNAIKLPPSPGVLVYNPPYGERMGDVQALVPLYKSIGDFMKQKGTGYTGWIFTGNIRLLKQVGLRANTKRVLYNGRIECRLADFDLY